MEDIALMKDKQTRSGFTLIELLVVIAIIAILAAILFPVFAQAKAAAKKTQSLSNTKQLVLASIMYAGDQDDNFCAEGEPGPGNGWGWQMTWQMLTVPYMKNYGILKDPTDNHTPFSNFDTGPLFSYPGNGIFAGHCSPGWAGWDMIGVIQSNRSWTNNYNSPRSATAVGLPAETIVFATRFKMHPTSWMYPGMDGVYSPWASTLLNSDGVDNGMSLPGQKNGLWAAADPTYDGVIYNGYGGQSPVGFVDGHAKSMKPTATVDIAKSIAAGNNGCVESGYYKMWDATRTQ